MGARAHTAYQRALRGRNRLSKLTIATPLCDAYNNQGNSHGRGQFDEPDDRPSKLFMSAPLWLLSRLFYSRSRVPCQYPYASFA
jgi:hypothetical protein